MAQAKNRYLEPNEREQLQCRFEALYVLEGMSIKKAAENTPISTVTAHKWINDLGLREKREAAIRKGKKTVYDANVLRAKFRIMQVPYFEQFVKDFDRVFHSI